MEASVTPYFFAVIADILVLGIFIFIKYVRIMRREKTRPLVWAFILWLCFNLTRNLLIILSAGTNATINRGDVLWLIRWSVVAEHAMLLLIGGLFFTENTTFAHVLPVQNEVSNESV